MVISSRHKFINKVSNKGKFFLDKDQEKEKGKILSKIKSGEYKFEYFKKCPLCYSSGGFEVLTEAERHGFNWNTEICRNCGLVFANPYFDKTSLKQFYNKHSLEIYRGLKEEDKKEIKFYFETQLERGKKIYDFIKKSIGTIKNKIILEVGCGSGGILSYFQNKQNNCLGIDYGKKYLEYGNRKKLNLYRGDISLLKEKKEKFDLIIYADVLEHIPDIEKELNSIKRLLKKNGYLFIKLPSIKNLKPLNGFFLKQIQNAHLYYFSLATLNNLMNKSGFHMVKGNENIYAIYKKSKSNGKSEIKKDYFEIKEHLLNQEKEMNKIKNITYLQLKLILINILIKTNTLNFAKKIKQYLTKK